MQVYLDNAATTAMRSEVLDEMIPYFKDSYGNASSIYTLARNSRKAIDISRGKLSKAIGSKIDEIYFTSGGTEADNWAIKGIAEAYSAKGKHIITSKIEHHAVLHTCNYLEKNGYEVTYLDVDKDGLISISELKKAIRPDTILITIMFANNEIGTIQSIGEIGCIARENKIFFHTDAVQAVGHVPVDVEEMKIDLLSLSGHKLNGPKGVGALYVRKGVVLKPLLHGGAHERGRRAGTENVPSIVGLGKAVEIAVEEIEENSKKVIALRQRLIDGILNKIPDCWLNGHPTKRLDGNVNISFSFIEGESILLMLDMKGVYASSGSACTSGSLDPSHVLLGIGLPHEKAHGSLRLTIGRENTEEEIDYVLEVLPPIVQRLREMSPLYNS